MSICKYRVSGVLALIVILLFNFKLVVSYEKTLRKIVRNQYKMVHQPFSESQNLISKKPSAMNSQVMYPGNAQIKTMYHKTQWPKLSTYLSLMDSSRTKSYSKSKITKGKNILPNELRQTRNTMANVTSAFHGTTENILFKKPDMYFNESNVLPSNSLDAYPPVASRFFPSADVNKNYNNQKSDFRDNIITLSSAETQTQSIFFSKIEENVNIKNSEKSDIIIIPYNAVVNNSLRSTVKSIYVANFVNSSKHKEFFTQNQTFPTTTEVETRQADFLLSGSDNFDYLNTIKGESNCKILKAFKANIDAQEKFTEFDIEPPWASKRHYWNSIFDSRYQSLMRNTKWPPLKVILIPRTHVDSIWRRSFQQYHNNSVNKMISNIVKKLQYYKNLTFSWNEVSHLSNWWKTAPIKSRMAFRRLLKTGRLEITTGGWVETDEATSHIFGLIHQLIEGQQWLKKNLNYSPNVGWLTNSVTHSPTMTYLLSASEVLKLVITNLHYSWEHYIAEFQLTDFVWQQNWDKIDTTTTTVLNKLLNKIGNDQYPKHSVLTHYLQFNSAGFKACGPNTAICINEFDFAKTDKNLDINAYNIKDKAELLLEQYSKTGTITSHNVVLAPIGGAYRYETQAEFDYQYNNYEKIADFVNYNRKIYKATLEFGTPSSYFEKILKRQENFQSLKGDFLNFADMYSGRPTYWTGFYTTRPLFKILLRRLQSTLRTTEILFSFAVSFNVFRRYNETELTVLLSKSRETVARLMDRNVIGGTLSVHALNDVHKQILTTAKDCWFIQEVSASLLSSKTDKQIPYLQKYVYRDGEFMSVFRTVTPGDQVYVFNSLSHTRTEVVELVTRNPNIRIVDHNKKEVTIQINPVWRYNSNNIIKISQRFFKISFAIVVPPMTLELFKIKETYDATQNAATLYCLSCVVDDMHNDSSSVFPFNILPLKDGDIKLESYKLKLIFDELTGFLKTVIEKETNIEKTVVIDFGAFKSSDRSGMFVFDAEFPKPIHDILFDYKVGVKSKIVLIISGRVGTQMTTVYGRLLKHTAKIFNLYNNPLSNAIYLVSKVDYDISPKNRDLELFISIQTDISNGYPPTIYTDNNGFQFTERTLNISRRIESNIYPITTMAYIQDNKNRLTFITDHAQGVTVLQEGQILAMVDRRVLYNDGRGTNEGLADNSATYHRHIILLENFEDPTTVKQMIMDNNLMPPSLTAQKLVEYHNYLLDIFVINKYQVDLCHYSFLPLIKASFPCDVSVINYRVDLNPTRQHPSPNTALMILQKLAFSCQIKKSYLSCRPETKFSLENILRNAKAVYFTNLAGTQKGVMITNLSEVNFATLEIVTLRVYF